MSKWRKAQFQAGSLVNWCGTRLRESLSKVDGPIHLLFATTDHYEPGAASAEKPLERSRMTDLLTDYPKLADGHRDKDNLPPRRSWFFPPHYHRYGNLPELVDLCARGYGEIELHLHHGKTEPDTEENLRATILQTLKEYSLFGIFGTEGGKKKYGFIHGDWALDNSAGGRYCGVNSEISVLRDTGCYADFTFPSIGELEAMPRKINSIYYATDNPRQPKSHDTGPDVEKGRPPSGDLMLIEGCLHPFFLDGRLKGLRVVGDALAPDRLGVPPKRVDFWVKTGIHVKGKRNWVFIKTHTHGALDAPTVTGRPMDEAFSYMERNYNDGDRYVLHYVTAREMYNIAKAAEAGEPGDDPHVYRNYRVAAPTYDANGGPADASAELQAMVARTYRG